jgi:hypothetical protein
MRVLIPRFSNMKRLRVQVFPRIHPVPIHSWVEGVRWSGWMDFPQAPKRAQSLLWFKLTTVRSWVHHHATKTTPLRNRVYKDLSWCQQWVSRSKLDRGIISLDTSVRCADDTSSHDLLCLFIIRPPARGHVTQLGLINRSLRATS